MSSATQYDPQAGRKAGNLVDLDKLARLGMSPRQQELNHFYSYYRCANYDARKVDWDGKEHADPIEREAIARGGFIPPGFYDAGATFPLKFRRPTAPYHLVRVIVDRFTGLLFSERRHPQLRVEGDEATEDYVQALGEAARLWPSMIQARAFGGSMGTVAVGFQFIDGKPMVEVHDPRWCRPTFADRATLRLSSIDKRYMFPQEERDPATGGWATVWYWYRRLVNEEHDVLWKPQLVGDGEEPSWENPANIEHIVEHGLGFCPVVWVQNMPVIDDIDGDPDCVGIYDTVESIDSLLAQANRGILANCDPTVAITSTDQLAEIAKGSDNAIKLTNGTASYLEASMAGPEAAFKAADNFRAKALEVAQCVLEHPDTAQRGERTATEVDRGYSSMYAKADVLREQYGERCVKPLMEMMVKAARIVQAPRAVDGQMVRGSLQLPERMVKAEDGTVQKAPRKLGPGGALKLQWPLYEQPKLSDISTAVNASGAAKNLGLLDEEHAAKFIAEHFGVEDVAAMLAKIRDARYGDADHLANQSLASLNATSTTQPVTESVERDERIPELPAPTGELTVTPSDLASIVRVNEARAAYGLDPLTREDGSDDPEGMLTITEFKASHAGVIQQAAQAEEPQDPEPEVEPDQAQNDDGQ